MLITVSRSAPMCRQDVALENRALRQQRAVYKETHQRPRLTGADRRFWVLLVIPKDIWHMAKVTGNARMLAVTAGQGAQHRPV
jgi:hypothetical protein